MKRDFLDMYLTTSFALRKLVNTYATKVIFFKIFQNLIYILKIQERIHRKCFVS